MDKQGREYKHPGRTSAQMSRTKLKGKQIAFMNALNKFALRWLIQLPLKLYHRPGGADPGPCNTHFYECAHGKSVKSGITGPANLPTMLTALIERIDDKFSEVVAEKDAEIARERANAAAKDAENAELTAELDMLRAEMAQYREEEEEGSKNIFM